MALESILATGCKTLFITTMKNAIRLMVFMVMPGLCLYAREAATSQVHFEDSSVTLEQAVKASKHIVIVTSSSGKEIYREEKIPAVKAPHPRPHEEITYREHVELYKVVEVFKSDVIKPGQTIKVWSELGFGFEMLKAQYNGDPVPSPIVQRYKPAHAPEEGKNLILFINDIEPDKDVYRFAASEGLSSKGDIEMMLKK